MDFNSGGADRGHIGGTVGLAFDLDGKSFWSVALDDSVRQWRLDITQDALLAWLEDSRHIEKMETSVGFDAWL